VPAGPHPANRPTGHRASACSLPGVMVTLLPVLAAFQGGTDDIEPVRWGQGRKLLSIHSARDRPAWIKAGQPAGVSRPSRSCRAGSERIGRICSTAPGAAPLASMAALDCWSPDGGASVAATACQARSKRVGHQPWPPRGGPAAGGFLRAPPKEEESDRRPPPRPRPSDATMRVASPSRQAHLGPERQHKPGGNGSSGCCRNPH